MQLCINNRRDYFEHLIKKKAYNSLLLIFFFMFHYFFSPLSILRVKEISLYFICLTIVRFCEAPIFTFELNVCQCVTKKTFQKKIDRGVLQVNKIEL